MYSNSDLIKHLIGRDALKSEIIIDAFRQIDRIDFVPDPTGSDVYEDHPLSIGFQQTISQPTTVAMMLEMLFPGKGEKILDIGSGSGWTTALLSYIAGETGYVIGLERIKTLVEFGKGNLDKYNFQNAEIIPAGKALGLPGETFDRILVSASADEFPADLTSQLKTGGKLVIPVLDSIYEITKKENGELDGLRHYGFTFVPLIF
ncbi:MAG: protein-L-isoaspartate O-methyltransferase [Spirochaetaceae bacterium]|nr:protein-L-isoaspartate O-methyltransferase [Spirochaetaceae bacterium]